MPKVSQVTAATPKTGSKKLRLIVTLAALAAFQFANAIPLPGVDLSQLAQEGFDLSSGLARFSIMALGMIPWLSALIIAELAVVVLPSAWTPWIRDGGHANPFIFPVIALALAFAAAQAYGVSVAMLAVPSLVGFADSTFIIVASATLFCGTAVTITLAALIQTRGIGPGFWVLAASLGVSEIMRNLLFLIEEGRIGMGTGPVLGVLLATLLAIAGLVALLGARSKLGFKRIEPVIWPLQLAGLALPWIAVLWSMAFSDPVQMNETLSSFFPHKPVGLIITAALIAAIVLIYCRKENSIQFFLPTAALLAAIAAVFSGLLPYVSTLVLTAGNLVLMTVVLHMMLAEWRVPEQ